MDGYEIHPIEYQMTREWIVKRHYARRMPKSIVHSFGLFEAGIMVGVITYSSPASLTLCENVCGKQWKHLVLELSRLVLLNNKSNEASFLVGGSLRLIPRPSIVVSYADTAQSHIGYIYQATNWIYTGCTRRNNDKADGNGHQRHSGSSAIARVRSPKHRYVYFVGNKRQVREMKNALRFPIEPYPKGDSLKYQVSQGDISGMQVSMFSFLHPEE